jgi:hypothetical protein
MAHATGWSLTEIAEFDGDDLVDWLESAKAVLNAK